MKKLTSAQTAALMTAFAHDHYVEIDPDVGISRATANHLVKRGLLVTDPDDPDVYEAADLHTVADALGYRVPTSKVATEAFGAAISAVFGPERACEVWTGEEVGSFTDVDEGHICDFEDAVALARMHVGRDESVEQGCVTTLLILAGFEGQCEYSSGYLAFWSED